MKPSVISVQGKAITVQTFDEQDYISLTDMAKGFDNSDQLIRKWLSNKETIEYLGVWERINNPDFNLSEFVQVRNEAGSNRFTMSVKKWTEITKGLSLKARSGRHGSGTFGHKDIAFEFGMWLSPEFKFLLIREFERLKEKETKGLGNQWDVRRFLAKTNYRTHTDAVKNKVLPLKNLALGKEGIVYADEAELLNVAVFGITSSDWKSQNPLLAKGNLNMRDYADTHQLIVLNNLESMNAMLLMQNVTDKKQRFAILSEAATRELKALSRGTDLNQPLMKSPNLPPGQAETTLIDKQPVKPQDKDFPVKTTPPKDFSEQN